MTCSITASCLLEATCCDGSSESCDGTKLPAGDGSNVGQFVISSDSLSVTDTITGLVWQRDGSSTRTGCTGVSNLTCTWAEAKAYCASLSLGGLTGWRLPGRTELYTIVDFTRFGPAIDQTAFPNTPPDNFWTSSPWAGSYGYAWYVDIGGGGGNGSASDSAWLVDFGAGLTDHKSVGSSSNLWVRCVR